MLRVEESHARNRRQDELAIECPGAPAIARAENDAARRARVGLGGPAGRPAGLLVDETHARKPAVDARGLQLPMLATIGGVPDDAAIAHRPAAGAVYKAHV